VRFLEFKVIFLGFMVRILGDMIRADVTSKHEGKYIVCKELVLRRNDSCCSIVIMSIQWLDGEIIISYCQ